MRFYTGLVIAASAPGLAQCTIRQHTKSDRTSPIPLSDLRAVEKCQLAKGDPNEGLGSVNKNCYDGPSKQVTSGRKTDKKKSVSVIFVGSAESTSEANERASRVSDDKCNAEIEKMFPGYRAAAPVNGEIDPALSPRGIIQSVMLQSFFQTGKRSTDATGCFQKRHVSTNGGCTIESEYRVHNFKDILNLSNTTFVTSNLRAGLMTSVVGLDGYLKQDQSRGLSILSALQEIGTTSDVRSSVSAGHVPPMNWGNECPYSRALIKVDPSCNLGDRNGFSLFHSKGSNRIAKFCDYAYQHAGDDNPVMVVVGHPVWLRSLSKTIVDREGIVSQYEKNACDQSLEDEELDNTGVVRFNIKFNAGLCRIERGSTRLLYGGFRASSSEKGKQ